MYFWRKTNSKFFWKGFKRSFFNWYGEMCCKIHFEIEMKEKWFLVVFWPFLMKKSHFGDPIDLQKNSHMQNWIYLIKTLHLNTHMVIFVLINFLTEKVAKLIETQNFLFNVLISHFYIKIHILFIIIFFWYDGYWLMES